VQLQAPHSVGQVVRAAPVGRSPSFESQLSRMMSSTRFKILIAATAACPPACLRGASFHRVCVASSASAAPVWLCCSVNHDKGVRRVITARLSLTGRGHACPFRLRRPDADVRWPASAVCQSVTVASASQDEREPPPGRDCFALLDVVLHCLAPTVRPSVVFQWRARAKRSLLE
jgi:hypothetical protein